jgi:hypothetical protein
VKALPIKLVWVLTLTSLGALYGCGRLSEEKIQVGYDTLKPVVDVLEQTKAEGNPLPENREKLASFYREQTGKELDAYIQYAEMTEVDHPGAYKLYYYVHGRVSVWYVSFDEGGESRGWWLDFDEGTPPEQLGRIDIHASHKSAAARHMNARKCESLRS